MTRSDKRHGENSGPSRLLRKLDQWDCPSAGLTAIRAQTMLGLNFREIELVSTRSDKHSDSGDKVAKGEHQSELALHGVPILSYQAEALGRQWAWGNICVPWLSPLTLSPPLVASHVSPH